MIEYSKDYVYFVGNRDIEFIAIATGIKLYTSWVVILHFTNKEIILIYGFKSKEEAIKRADEYLGVK